MVADLVPVFPVLDGQGGHGRGGEVWMGLRLGRLRWEYRVRGTFGRGKQDPPQWVPGDGRPEQARLLSLA